MMRRFIALAAAGLVGLVLTAPGRADKEEKVPLDKLPKAVAEAVKARFPKGELLGAEKEKEGGKTVYEVAIKNKGQSIEVTLTPDGKLVEIEKQIVADKLPRAVADALKDKYAGAKYKMIEEVIKVKDGEEKLAYYEVLLVTAEGREFEVSVAPDGTIRRTEARGKAKKDKD
jgi:uncharacterized membrane protein YkoI